MSLFPQFSPHQARDASLPEPLGPNLRSRCALPGHSQDDCLYAISPTQILQYWTRTSSRLGGNLNHMLAPTIPLGPKSGQLRPFQKRNWLQASIGPNGPNSKMERQDLWSRTLANEWPFRRRYLRTHTSSSPSGCCPLQQVFRRVPGSSHPDPGALLDVDFQIESTASERQIDMASLGLGLLPTGSTRSHSLIRNLGETSRKF